MANHILNGSVPEWTYEPTALGCAFCPAPDHWYAQGFGGEVPVMWQHQQNCAGYGDLDAASSLPP